MLNVASTLLSFLATMLPVSALLPVSATISNEILSFRQSQNKLNVFSLFRLCRKDKILRYSFDIGFSGGPVMLNQWEIEDSCKAHSKINRKLFAVYGSNDVVQPKDGLFGVRTMSNIIWENVPRKPPKRGVNRHFQAKLA